MTQNQTDDSIIKPIPDEVKAMLDFADKFGRRMCWPPAELACDWDAMMKPIRIETDEPDS